jgi:hypothetical protein
MIYLIYSKSFCKYHNVPPPSTTIKEKKDTVEKIEPNFPAISRYDIKFQEQN